MSLKIESTLMKINNVNLRKENNGDEKVMATDISMEVNLPVKSLEMIVVDKTDWSFLWDKDGEINGHCIEHINIFREFEDHAVTIAPLSGISSIEFASVKIKKIKFKPEPAKRITVKFQIQVHPTKDQNGDLSALNLEDATVSIFPPKQMDFEDQ